MTDTIELDKLTIEEGNRNLRDKARTAEITIKRLQIEVVEKQKQVRCMTDQNDEILRLLEAEEHLTDKLQGEGRAALRAGRAAPTSISAKSHEELVTKAAEEAAE